MVANVEHKPIRVAELREGAGQAGGECLRVFVHVAGVRGIASGPLANYCICAGMDGKGYLWKGGALQKSEHHGHEVYEPYGYLQNIKRSGVMLMIFDKVVAIAQVASFAFLDYIPWNDMVAPLKVTNHTQTTNACKKTVKA